MTRPLSIATLAILAACSGKNPEREAEPAVAVSTVVDAAIRSPPQKPFVPLRIARDWWKQKDAGCKDGASLRGAEPPEGTALWCESAAGIKHGPFIAWHHGGAAAKGGALAIERLGPYVDGKEHGTWLLFWPNGRKKFSISYQAGERHGQYREFRVDGRKSLDGWYQQGVPNGTFTSYDSQGQLIANTVVVDGTGPMQRYHPNRSKALQYRVVAGLVHGLWTSWDDNGTKVSELSYEHGSRTGPTTRWGPTGLVIERGGYLDDMKDGEWIRYKRGQEVGRTRYRRGQVVKP